MTALMVANKSFIEEKKISLTFIYYVLIAQAQSAPPQSLPLLANPALSSLEPWTATMKAARKALSNAVAVGVTRILM